MNYLDEHSVGLAIWQSLKENNPENIMKILSIYINAKIQSEEISLPKDISRALTSKNPTLKTLAKIISSVA